MRLHLRRTDITISNKCEVTTYLFRVKIEDLKAFEGRGTGEGNVRLAYARKLDGVKEELLYIPFSKTLPKSTFTRSSVCPCDLWMLIAHDKISGSYTRTRSGIPKEETKKQPT